MPAIQVVVDGVPGNVTYSEVAAEPGMSVQSNGDVTVTTSGDHYIIFLRGRGQTWTFQDVEIRLESGVPHEVSKTAVTPTVLFVHDVVTGEGTYYYTLKTTAGDFDPVIRNRSGR